MTQIIQVLDKGYVRLVPDGVMGSDLSVVNAAKVSYNKESDSLAERDTRLINFLAREHHTSPFRHCSICFEVYAPLMVARQWWKHHVASSFVDEQDGWNESSRRYVTENEEFYVPNKFEWRSVPENSKQGSGAPVAHHIGGYYTKQLELYIQQGESLYQRAMTEGIAPEMARLFLPANGMYVRFRWHVGLQAVTHFLNLRVAKDSQVEIQEYAKAVEQYVAEAFPISYQALKTGGNA